MARPIRMREHISAATSVHPTFPGTVFASVSFMVLGLMLGSASLWQHTSRSDLAPGPGSVPILAGSVLRVSITSDGSRSLNGLRVSEDALRQAFIMAGSQKPPPTIILRASVDTKFEHVRDVMQAAQAQQLYDIRLEVGGSQ